MRWPMDLGNITQKKYYWQGYATAAAGFGVENGYEEFGTNEIKSIISIDKCMELVSSLCYISKPV